MRRLTLIKLFLRCFIVQSVMGMRYMQSFGFAYAIYPGLHELYPEGREQTKVLRRHLSFFHTHPVFFPCILGCILRGEIETTRGEGDSTQLALMKDILMGPLSALGDGFFWASLRPLAAIVGVTLGIKGSLWGPVFLLVIYNLPNFWFRLTGFINGLGEGFDVLVTIRKWRLTRFVRWIRTALALLGGAMLALWVHAEAIHPILTGMALWTALCSLLLAVALQWLLSRGFSAIYLLYIAALVVGGVAFFMA